MQEFLSISGLFNAVVSLIFGIIVLSKNKQQRINQIFFLLTLATASWSIGYWRWMALESNYDLALSWIRLLTISSFFMPIFYFHWVTIFIEKKYKIILLLGYLSTFFYCFFIFSNELIAGLQPQPSFIFYPVAGRLYSLFLITNFFGLFFGGSLLLFVNFLKSHGLKRAQLLYAVVGATIAIAGGGTNFFLWYGINIPPIGNILVPFYVILFSVAIIKYRLMGIKTIVSRLYTYGLLAAFSYAFFYFAILTDEAILGSIYHPGVLVLGPLKSVLFAILLVPLFDKIQKSSDSLFYSNYNPRRIIKDLSIKLNSVINLNQLLISLSEEFKKILTTEDIAVFVFNRELRERQDICYRLGNEYQSPLKLGSDLKQSLFGEKKIIIRDEEERAGRKKIVKEMDNMKAKVISPLTIHSKVIGFILLKDKLSDDPYTQEDIEFLEIISSQAAVAIENAHLYQEVEDFNMTLQHRVDEQTQELQTKADHLKKLMEMRSEFLDITSHQLRTPVSVIKGVLSMMEEGSVPPEKQKDFIRGALEKSIKLGEIINDILRASEMDTERFSLHLKSVDLNELFKKVEAEKIRSANARNIKLNFILPPEPLPPVLSDDRYLEQALVNLINNALQYTIKGSITVSVTAQKKTVLIRIIDTGIGIPKKDLPKLFQKFGRAENAVVTYTDGSGLGLYIIKEIIDANPGAKIEIEKTDVNKGTTMAMTLPIYDEKLLQAAVVPAVAKATQKV